MCKMVVLQLVTTSGLLWEEVRRKVVGNNYCAIHIIAQYEEIAK